MDPVTQAVLQLVAVVVGGLLTIIGTFASAILLERYRLGRESLSLALAFHGEITAILELFTKRRYAKRLLEIVGQIEATREPFYMPLRLRHEYDRVYRNNVEKLGQLKHPLPELIPVFYIRLSSIFDDASSLADGTYAGLELEVLLRIYRDLHDFLVETVDQGQEIIAEINRLYDLPQTSKRPTNN
jgi:hypothetical protein